MSTPARGMLRVTRASALALVTVALALGAHLSSGGSAPSTVGLGLVAAPVALLSVALTARRLGVPVLLGAFAATQLGLHYAFESLSAPVAGLAPDVGMPGAHHGGGLTHVGGVVSDAGMVGHGTSGWMIAAHVVAALACALVLAHGESTVWALVGWLLPTVPRLAVVSVPVVRPLLAQPQPVLVSPVWLTANRLRGPPPSMTSA